MSKDFLKPQITVRHEQAKKPCDCGLSESGYCQCVDSNVGDVNSDEKGSGARFNAGKTDYSLFPLDTLDGACRVLMYGESKYAAWNWAKGSPWSVPYGSLMRHLNAFMAGEDIDSESGQHHLDHVMCNVMFLIYYRDNYPEGDDRFKRL